MTPEIYRFRFTPEVPMDRARDLVVFAQASLGLTCSSRIRRRREERRGRIPRHMQPGGGWKGPR